MPRKSPTESATLFKVGTKKKGNDGNMWEVKTTKTGVKRWTKIKEVKIPKGRKYYTHWNGGYPFMVVVNGKTVNVYKSNYNDEYFPYKPECYQKHVKEFKNVKKIFIGKDIKSNKWTIGNTILLKMSKNKYIFIGRNIYSFETTDDIIKYYSFINWPNDIPFPIAIGKENVYYLSDKKYVSKDKLPKEINNHKLISLSFKKYIELFDKVQNYKKSFKQMKKYKNLH